MKKKFMKGICLCLVVALVATVCMACGSALNLEKIHSNYVPKNIGVNTATDVNFTPNGVEPSVVDVKKDILIYKSRLGTQPTDTMYYNFFNLLTEKPIPNLNGENTNYSIECEQSAFYITREFKENNGTVLKHGLFTLGGVQLLPFDKKQLSFFTDGIYSLDNGAGEAYFINDNVVIVQNGEAKTILTGYNGFKFISVAGSRLVASSNNIRIVFDYSGKMLYQTILETGSSFALITEKKALISIAKQMPNFSKDYTVSQNNTKIKLTQTLVDLKSGKAKNIKPTHFIDVAQGADVEDLNPATTNRQELKQFYNSKYTDKMYKATAYKIKQDKTLDLAIKTVWFDETSLKAIGDTNVNGLGYKLNKDRFVFTGVGGTISILDKKGTIIKSLNLVLNQPTDLSVIGYLSNDKNGYLDVNGNVVVDSNMYNNVTDKFSNGYALASKNVNGIAVIGRVNSKGEFMEIKLARGEIINTPATFNGTSNEDYTFLADFYVTTIDKEVTGIYNLAGKQLVTATKINGVYDSLFIKDNTDSINNYVICLAEKKLSIIKLGA